MALRRGFRAAALEKKYLGAERRSPARHVTATSKAAFAGQRQAQEAAAEVGLAVSAYARAEAAFRFEFDRWQIQIDALRANTGLSSEQRFIGLASLRFRQQVDAQAARQRVMEEEIEKAKAVRLAARRRYGLPTPC